MKKIEMSHLFVIFFILIAIFSIYTSINYSINKNEENIEQKQKEIISLDKSNNYFDYEVFPTVVHPD